MYGDSSTPTAEAPAAVGTTEVRKPVENPTTAKNGTEGTAGKVHARA